MMVSLHGTKQAVFKPLYLFTGFTVACSILPNLPAIAQIIPDNSLGNESSVVVPNVNINGINSDRIDGGAIRGSNLFHSFQEFNIDNGRGAYFSNPESISNILTRVTGNNLSNILGTLGVLGNANLFLINPNGIVFGPNARLDVGGSFFASTADGILFENGVEFAASNSDAPPLLTINIPLGLNFRENPGTIQVEGTGHNLSIDPETGATIRDNRPVGLQVPDGQTLALIGGDISLEGGNLTAAGRIELGSVSGSGTVVLNSQLDEPLNYEEFSTFSRIQLAGAASVDASGDGGGNINVQAGQIELVDGSVILLETLGSELGGTLTVNASESLELVGTTVDGQIPSALNTGVGLNGTGRGADLNVTAGTLRLSAGGQIGTSTVGEGNGGNLNVRANEIELVGTSTDALFPTGLFAVVAPGATGDAGNLDIDAQNLLVRDSATILTSTFSEGDGGNLDIDAQTLTVQGGSQIGTGTFSNGNSGDLTIRANDVQLLGSSADGQANSGLFTSVGFEAIGSGGSLNLNAQTLTVQDGAQIDTSTFGSGDAGNLTIRATDIQLINSALGASIQSGSIGNGGNLTIDTQRLVVRDGAIISADTFGQGNSGELTIRAIDSVEVSGNSSFISANVGLDAFGNAGNLTIDTQNLLIHDGARISTGIFGNGDAGNLTINTQNLTVQDDANISTQVNSGAEGNGGNLMIDTQTLMVQNSAQISASTFSNGDGGNLDITAIDIQLVGEDSGLFSGVSSEAVGNGGSLTVNTQTLTVQGGAEISASTFGNGDGGDLIIDTQTLRVEEGAQISTGIFGTGDAGDLTIKATDVQLLGTGSVLDAGVDLEGMGRGGNLTIDTQNLLVRDGAQIGSGTFGNGDSGNITITATDIELVGTSADGQFSSGIFTNVEQQATGNSGNVQVNTQRLLIRDSAQISASTFGNGNAGSLIITATDIELTGTSSGRTLSGLQAAVGQGAIGTGGSITIDTQNLLVRDNAQISSSTQGLGNAGNITIRASDVQVTEGRFPDGSGIASAVGNGGRGNGGDITIDTQRLLVRDGGVIATSIFGDQQIASSPESQGIPGNGNAGHLTIRASSVELIGLGGLSANTGSGAIGNSGDLTIDTQSLLVQNGAQITVSIGGNGNAGNVNINATDVEITGVSSDDQIPGGILSLVEPGAVGNGGIITLNTQNLLVQDGTAISTTTAGNGNAGNITIDAQNIAVIGESPNRQNPSGIASQVFSGEGVEIEGVSARGNGDGGTVMINTERLLVQDGASISTSTGGDGNAGNIRIRATDIEISSPNNQSFSGIDSQVNPGAVGNGGDLEIDTQTLSVLDGARVNAGTSGNGNAGNLVVNADSIEVGGTILIPEGETFSVLTAIATPESTGKAGDLTVTANEVIVRDLAGIDVRSFNSEPAGNLTINAPVIELNQGGISAETSGGQGNIFLNTEDLRLRDGSIITTNATGEATGGNIEINTETLTALENSDISANAEDAFGGRIIINAAGVFGTTFREQQTRFSDITATSERGPEFSGTVELNTELDPSSGLIDLSQTVVDPNELIAQEFCRQRGASQFIITGRGGIAADPNDKATGDQIEVDLVEPVPSQPRNTSRKRSETEDNQAISSLDIVPARGWIRDENGDVILVSYDPTKTGVRRQPSQLPQCQPSLNGEDET